jgi:hypothetical protein
MTATQTTTATTPTTMADQGARILSKSDFRMKTTKSNQIKSNQKK